MDAESESRRTTRALVVFLTLAAVATLLAIEIRRPDPAIELSHPLGRALPLDAPPAHLAPGVVRRN